MASCASTGNKPIEGISNRISEIKTLVLEEGTMVYEDSMGKGPVIICIPGMGDTRGQFRLLAPKLVKEGFRVVTVDPRGQGDSSATFKNYSAKSVGEDIIKLINKFDGPLYLVGNSSGGASAAWAASFKPDKVKGLILLAAFLRDHPRSFWTDVMLRASLIELWGTSFWISYYKSLFITHIPEDQERYTEALSKSLKQSGHIPALSQMVFASKSEIEGRLSEVLSPALAIGGSEDPDFKDPEAELTWISSKLPGRKTLIKGAGHYPHLEFPDKVLKSIQNFIGTY